MHYVNTVLALYEIGFGAKLLDWYDIILLAGSAAYWKQVLYCVRKGLSLTPEW